MKTSSRSIGKLINNWEQVNTIFHENKTQDQIIIKGAAIWEETKSKLILLCGQILAASFKGNWKKNK